MEHDALIAATLIDIEAELRGIGHWDRVSPPVEALRSEQPFAVDTLRFN
ncbi:MAG: YqcC family protein, partial [Spongiibacter sp.]